MNRAQRRAAERQGTLVTRKPTYNMDQDAINAIREQAYNEGRLSAADGYTEGFMYGLALSIKVLHERQGWGSQRVTRLMNFVLDEFNSNDMTWEEINTWLWNYAGFKLEKDNKEK